MPDRGPNDDLARRARELETLAEGICVCVRCRLHRGRRHAVPGEGDPHARVMLIGEAPGEREDQLGRPFVGRSGKFLDELLGRHGLAREQLFITGSVKCRPPDNRRPKEDELDICKQAWLLRQIELIDPAILVLMGQTAMWQVLGQKAELRDVHGQMRPWQGRRCLLTYHPAAGMRFPVARKAMEEDFGKLRELTGRL